MPTTRPAHSACTTVLTLACAALGLAPACGAAEGSVLSAPLDGSASSGTPAPTDASFTSGDGGNSSFVVDIENDAQVVLTVVTLGCTSPCEDLQAVAQGGSPPYTYAWSDGASGASRHLCPAASTTTLTVTVTDAGVSGGEFARQPITTTGTLQIHVASCSDAASDAGAAPVCLTNPSFEGTPTSDPISSTAQSVPSWTICGPAVSPPVNLWNASETLPGQSTPSLAPTDGKTYLAIASCTSPGCIQIGSQGDEILSQPLCATLHAGTTYALQMDLYSAPSQSMYQFDPASLAIWGGTTECGVDELLWTSPITGSSWKTYCATLTPTHDYAYITMEPHLASGLAYLGVDHLVPVAGCQ
jgi:hypothetical protein